MMEDELAELIDEALEGEGYEITRIVNTEPSPFAKALASQIMDFFDDKNIYS